MVLASWCRVPVLAIVLAGVLVGTAGAQTLVVSAASSLTDAFEAVAAAFEAEHGVRVDLNLAGSSTLAAQILQGAPIDVFASADRRQMQVVRAAGLLADEPLLFARNRMVVVATEDGPVGSLADLAEPGVLLVLAGPDVPAGAYARAAIDGLDEPPTENYAERVYANVVSEEPNVRQVAAKVALGEADAAIVYASDAALLDGVRTIPLPLPPGARPEYPVAVLARSTEPRLARAFVTYLRSPSAQAILERWGFEPVPVEPAPTGATRSEAE